MTKNWSRAEVFIYMYRRVGRRGRTTAPGNARQRQ